MPSSPPTPAQVHAHRFAVRRLESALVGRDPTLRRDPGRRQQRALISGAIIGLVALIGFAVIGMVRGDEDWRRAAIVRGTPSGALYTVAHDPDRLVPALNLTSARLLAAVVSPPGDDPADAPGVTVVRDDALAAAPRTAPAGIAGAPAVLPDPGAPAPDVWSVCDTVALDDAVADPAAISSLTTVVLGGVADTGRRLPQDEALLLRQGTTFWLVTEGRRARIDPRSGSVLRGLGIIGPRPRPASAALVAALPEGPPLAPVVVGGSGLIPGEPRTAALGVPVGSVVSPDGARFFLVAVDGVQEVPAVVAQIARFSNTDPAADPGIAGVPERRLAAAPRVRLVDTRAYPATFPRVVDHQRAGAGGTVACVRPGAGGPAVTTVAPSVPVPTTPLAGGGASGTVTGAHVAGAGAYVAPAGPGRAPETSGGLLVDPTGRAFTVPDARTAAGLGLGGPRPAPATIIDLLPRGPVLDPASALLVR